MITGSVLKEKREALNLSCLEVANRSCLSLNQVKALESDDISPFYSIQIRQLCINRVALILDIEPQCLSNNEPNLPQETLLNISAPAELSMLRHAHEKLFAIARELRPFIVNATMLITVLVGINFLLKTGLDEPVQENQNIKHSAAIIVETETTLDTKINSTPLAETKPLAKEILTKLVTEVVKPKSLVTEMEDSCTKDDVLLDVKVESPIKPPNKVYFTSATPQKICVSDANGMIKHFNLSTDASNIFSGAPPFIIAAEHFDSLSLFFQGKKVNLNGAHKTAVQLTASPLS
jgi:transcriptional regulator with XRE-family HTH domain